MTRIQVASRSSARPDTVEMVVTEHDMPENRLNFDLNVGTLNHTPVSLLMTEKGTGKHTPLNYNSKNVFHTNHKGFDKYQKPQVL